MSSSSRRCPSICVSIHLSIHPSVLPSWCWHLDEQAGAAPWLTAATHRLGSVG